MTKEQAELLLKVIDAKIAHQGARSSEDGGLNEYLVEAATVADFLATFDAKEAPIGEKGLWYMVVTGHDDPTMEAIRAVGLVNFSYYRETDGKLMVQYSGPRLNGATAVQP